MDRWLAGREYASHLTDADLHLLASVAGGPAGQVTQDAAASRLRGDPEGLLRLLEHPGVFRAVLGSAEASWAVPASPFLVFAAFVQQAAAELASAGHVPERTGLRQRVPLFDAPALRDFLGEPARRLFLAELLASFTHLASGRYRVRAGGRMRTRRFSELDPVQMEVWEYLGARWYRAARELAPVDTARIAVVGDVADRFRQARRVLNHLADRYVLPGKPWFEQPSF